MSTQPQSGGLDLGQFLAILGALGGIGGLYSMQQARKRRPRFSHHVIGINGKDFERDGRTWARLPFTVLFRNESDSANTLTHVHLVSWKGPSRVEALRFGSQPVKVTEEAGSVLHLPIRFEEKDAKSSKSCMNFCWMGPQTEPSCQILRFTDGTIFSTKHPITTIRLSLKMLEATALMNEDNRLAERRWSSSGVCRTTKIILGNERFVTCES